MDILRRIFVMTFIAVFSIQIVIGSAAHASMSDCFGDHCQTGLASVLHDLESNSPAEDPSHDLDNSNFECCDQLSCQTIALTTQHLISSPTDFSNVNWGKTGQLMAFVRQNSLDRPPNL